MRVFLITLVIIGFSLFATQAAFAQGLVPCNGPDCQTCSLVKLANNIIAWLVGFLVAAGTLVFAYGGFLMVTSAGDTGKVSQAKGLMTNVVIGLVIFLTGYIVVDTVLKTIVNDQKIGPWNQIKCVEQPSFVDKPAGTVTAAPSGAVAQYSCSQSGADCVPVTSTNVPLCVGGSGTRIIDPDYADKLEAVGGGWCATSIGLESGHANACHTTYANCIDAKCTSSSGSKKDCTASEAAVVQASFKKEGLWPVYEFPSGTSEATLQEYRSKGVCAYIEPASTGAHFSVYVSRDSGSGQFAKAGCN